MLCQFAWNASGSQVRKTAKLKQREPLRKAVERKWATNMIRLLPEIEIEL